MVVRVLAVAALLLSALSAADYIKETFVPEPPAPGVRTQGEIWPLPQDVVYEGTPRRVGASKSRPIQIVFDRDHESCDVLQFTRRTYLSKWMMPFDDSGSNAVDTITLKVSIKDPCPGPDEFPQDDMDESYFLNVPETGPANMDAIQVWGALRGIETFSQLLFVENDTYWLRPAVVKDFPRFVHRGFLIDTSRHYLSPLTLKRQIDLLAMNKMNVFHWHMIDIQSFPYVSKKFPNLSRLGAYSPKHTYDPDTVQDIIHYARLRGVRVMAEVDTPGHTGSWKGQPGFLSKCTDETGAEIESSILDPTKPHNYRFLTELLEEISQVFPEKYIHLGGDEVWMYINNCWLKDPAILQFMKLQGFQNVTQLETYYFNKLQKIVDSIDQSKKQVFWEEVFDNNKPQPDSIIHIWLGNDEAERGAKLAAVTKAGYQAILSSCWYLNYIAYGADWGNYYKCDPQAFNGTIEEKSRVIGGEVCMWGEYVDSTNIESRTWPRASAAAERLWSNRNATQSVDAAWPRLHEFRCRMLARGFRAEPGYGPSFCPIEWSQP